MLFQPAALPLSRATGSGVGDVAYLAHVFGFLFSVIIGLLVRVASRPPNTQSIRALPVSLYALMWRYALGCPRGVTPSGEGAGSGGTAAGGG
jgi:hypothetical protein